MSTTTSFVGRRQELSALETAWRDVADGRPTLVVVLGEAGMGKTALVGHWARSVRLSGQPVALGRAWESGGAPAFWPWTQVLTSLGVPAPWQDSPAAEGDSAAQRFSVFTAVTSSLVARAAGQPLVVVLDDLHVADRESQLLVEFLASQVVELPVMLVVTARPDGSPAQNQLERWAQHVLRLGPLSRDELEDLVRSTGDGEDPTALAEELTRVSEGHPLFACELLRVLRSDAPRRSLLTARVIDVLGQRLDVLEASDRAVLRLAALLGRDVEPDLLTAVAGQKVGGALTRAVATGILTADAGDLPRFSHVLFRDVLEEELDPTDRAALHARVYEVLGSWPQTDAVVAARAHHALRAPGPQRASVGVSAAWLAATNARAQLAWEHATELYLAAIDCVGSREVPAQLLLEAGDTLVRAGRIPEGKALLSRAFTAASSSLQTASDRHVVVESALAYAGYIMEGGVVDATSVHQLEQALAAVDPDDRRARARLMSRLASELTFSQERERVQDMARQAWTLALVDDDPMTVAQTGAWCYSALYGPDTLAETRPLLDRVTRAATVIGDLELQVRAHCYEASQSLREANVVAFRGHLRWLRDRAEQIGAPLLKWASDFDAYLELLHGAPARALSAAEAAFAMAADQPNGFGTFVAQSCSALWELERMIELEPALLAGVQDRPGSSGLVRAALAAARAQAGRSEEADTDLEQLANDLPELTRDSLWEWLVYWWSEAAWLRRHRASSLVLLPVLTDLLPRQLIGTALKPAVYLSSLHRPVGLLHLVLGNMDEAREHLEQALKDHQRIGASLLAARSQLELAQALPLADPRRVALLAEALSTGQRLEAPWLLTQIDQVSRGAATARARDALGQVQVHRDRGFWTIVHEGQQLNVKSSKGMTLLETLLRRPGQEVHALELAGSGKPTAAGTPVLDPQAREAYRRRIQDLRDEIAEAADRGAAEAAARAQDEMDAIARELARATGLGGRDRLLGSSSEQARINTTKLIKAAIDRIAAGSPALGGHLRAAVRTGTYSSYDPKRAERPLTWVFL